MRIHKDRRKSLRLSVDLDLSCELACGTIFEAKMINMSKAGILMKVTGAADLKEKEKYVVKFSLPDNPKPMYLEGEPVWSRSYLVNGNKNGIFHLIGVNFINMTETCRGQIQSFIMEAIHVESQLRSLGIARLMSEIRKLSPAARLKSYHLLIRTGHASLKC